MALDSKKKSRWDRMMCSNNFEMQEARGIGQIEADKSRGFPTSSMRITDEGFQMEEKKCKDQERSQT